MEINVYQQVFLKDKLNTFRTAHREFQSSVIPHKGDFYSDTAFKDPYEHEVKQVVIDYAEDLCSIYIDPIVIDSEDPQRVIDYVKMMMSHGWKCNVL